MPTRGAHSRGWQLPGAPLLRSLVLVTASATSAAVAALGVAVLGWLLVTQATTPSTDTFIRSLSLDYNQSDLVGRAIFLPRSPGEGLVLSDVPPDAR